jgi:hypothetical protein
MQWKQALRAQLRADGHRLTPITRTSLRPKGAHLHDLRNRYEATCMYCRLIVRVQTFPGSKAEVKLSTDGAWPAVTEHHDCITARRQLQRKFRDAGIESFFSTGKAAFDETAL